MKTHMGTLPKEQEGAMNGQEFGPLVKRAARAKGLSQGRLGYLLTDDDGPFIDSSRVRLLYEGKWRLTHATVERLIDLLAPYLDPAEAWAASGLLPPGVDADMLRRLDLFASRTPVAAGTGRTALKGQYVQSPAYAHDLGKLIVFPLERRRSCRRRQPRFLEVAEAAELAKVAV